jgi:hypothetical protein
MFLSGIQPAGQCAAPRLLLSLRKLEDDENLSLEQACSTSPLPMPRATVASIVLPTALGRASVNEAHPTRRHSGTGTSSTI